MWNRKSVRDKVEDAMCHWSSWIILGNYNLILEPKNSRISDGAMEEYKFDLVRICV